METNPRTQNDRMPINAKFAKELVCLLSSFPFSVFFPLLSPPVSVFLHAVSPGYLFLKKRTSGTDIISTVPVSPSLSLPPPLSLSLSLTVCVCVCVCVHETLTLNLKLTLSLNP